MNEPLPALQTNTTDYVASLARGTFGAIPFVGPIAAEIVGHVIPNQRADRIIGFAQLLEERVGHLEQEAFRDRCLQNDSVDLIEDGLFQAARAKSQQRLEHIANVVTHGLTDEQQKQAEAGKMLWLLEKLTDMEVILLRSNLVQTRGDIDADMEFRERHAAILAPRDVHLGSSWDEIEEDAIHTSHKQHLVELGLLRPNFKKPKRGEIPEFDPATGMMKASGHTITLLGKILLRYLNLIPEWAETES
jgi:hypothetical protein